MVHNNKPEKKPQEPQWYLSATGIPTYNYKVYNMSFRQKVVSFFVAFFAGAAVGYLFYGGIGVDEFGQPTTTTRVLNIMIPAILGIVAGRLYLPMRKRSLIARNKKELSHQFRDMLDALTTSLGAGKNVTDAFSSTYDDLKIQYESDAHIIRELEVILSGMRNNIAIEDLLEDFGIRSDNDDIYSFANVFKICYRKGGNIKDVVRATHDILSEKMEIAEDIETLVTSNKMEQNIMVVMPIALIAMIKLMSPEFAANFVTPSGIASTTFSIIIFVIAYIVGKKVLDIKI